MKQARVGVSIILISKDLQVLVGKRKGSHGEGMWSVPGGHLEYMETYKDACDRELLEEVGVKFDNYEKVGFSEDVFGEKQYTTLYFAVKGIDTKKVKIRNMEPHKCEEWKWIHIEQLQDKLFCDTYNQIHTLFEKMTVIDQSKKNSFDTYKEKWKLK